jgi:hypothetical protein
MAKKYYAQRLFDFLRPSNPSTDGTSRSGAKNFFDNALGRLKLNRKSKNPNQAPPHTESIAEPATNGFGQFPNLPTELRVKIIQSAIPNAALRSVNREFNSVFRSNEIWLWSQAWIAKEKAKKSNSNAVSHALPDCDPAELSNPDNALNLLIFQFQTRPNIPLEKIAEAFVNIANNPKSDGKARITAFGKLGEIGGILEMKEHSPRAARIAAWGLRELIDSVPRETDDPRMLENARRCLESLTGNEKKCMDDVLDSKAAAQPTAAGRRPTAQILLSALKLPAKTWKLIQDTRHRGRSDGGRA